MASVKVRWVVLGLTTFHLMVSACLSECVGSKRVSYTSQGQAMAVKVHQLRRVETNVALSRNPQV